MRFKKWILIAFSIFDKIFDFGPKFRFLTKIPFFGKVGFFKLESLIFDQNIDF